MNFLKNYIIGWLVGRAGSTDEAFCKACKSQLITHKQAIYRHALSSKHRKNLEKYSEVSILNCFSL